MTAGVVLRWSPTPPCEASEPNFYPLNPEPQTLDPMTTSVVLRWSPTPLCGASGPRAQWSCRLRLWRLPSGARRGA